MINVTEADKIIEKNLPSFPLEESRLENSYGAVLAEDLSSDRDQPPFNKSLMDGIAFSFSSWDKGRCEFSIEGTQAAGDGFKVLKDQESCWEIMTGAAVPEGCDCIVPIEKVKVENNKAFLDKDLNLEEMEHIRPKGADYKEGDLLLTKGVQLSGPQIGVAAAIGKSKLSITKKVKTAIISTGDEIVEIDKPIQPFQIRQSNSYALQTMFNRSGFMSSDIFHMKDDKKELTDGLAKLLQDYDVLVLSGGVSMGKFDFVPEVLKDLGVEVLFHKIKQKPGKPMWFGKNKEGKVVFALPGNPVSTQVCAYRYVIHHLQKAVGITNDSVIWAQLAEDFEYKNPLTYFLPVRIKIDNSAQQLAYPVPFTGSGDFTALSKVDGFLELEENKEKFPKGQIFKFFPFRS